MRRFLLERISLFNVLLRIEVSRQTVYLRGRGQTVEPWADRLPTGSWADRGVMGRPWGHGQTVYPGPWADALPTAQKSTRSGKVDSVSEW